MVDAFNVVGMAGSLRTGSYSVAVLDAIRGMLPANAGFQHVDIGRIPHYSEDIEHDGLPESVEHAREAVHAASALVIVTPEYNHGLPGVLKNALDWLSRPAFNSCMVGKPVFFVTLSGGALGGVRAQYQLRETLASMFCALVPLPEIAITHIGNKVQNGVLVEQAALSFIDSTLQRFLASVSHSKSFDTEAA